MGWGLNFFMKVEMVPAVLKYCKQITNAIESWTLSSACCATARLLYSPWCLCLPWAWLQPEGGSYLFFYSITATVLFVLHSVLCPVCISGLVFAPLVGEVPVHECVWVWIIPKSSQNVAGMFPVFNKCNLWMLVIEQLFIYIYINIYIEQAASSFSCNFSVYWKAWVFGDCI